jgi:glycosyl transferase family 2
VYEGKIVAVVVPAYNEEKLIGTVLDTMPDFVDLIIVIDDASTDCTFDIVASGVIAPFPSTMPPVAHVERLRLSPLG